MDGYDSYGDQDANGASDAESLTTAHVRWRVR
jgi:hypothetical protein